MGRKFSRFLSQKAGLPGEQDKEMLKMSPFFFAAMFYVYILLSERSGHYYIGHTDDPIRRLFEHNHADEVTYTSKYRPWELVFKYPVSGNRSDAIIIERYLKKRKSKTLLNKLILKQEDQSFMRSFIEKILNKSRLP